MFLATEEQDEFRAAVRQMCEDKLAPRAAETDDKARYPWYAHEAFSAMGFRAMASAETRDFALNPMAMNASWSQPARAPASASTATRQTLL